MKDAAFALLRKIGLFASISDEKLIELIACMEKIELSAGDVLFEKGANSDSFYVVVNGLLGAIVVMQNGDKKISGKIRRGEIVGEMGVFSSQPRSVAVEALDTTTVFKLTLENFKLHFDGNVDELIELSKIILHRTKKTYETVTNARVSRNILILPANKVISYQPFYGSLEAELKNNNLEIGYYRLSEFQKKLKDNSNIDDYIAGALVGNDFNIIIADIEDDDLFNIAIAYIDKIGILTSGDKPKLIDAHVQNKLNTHHSHYMARELIFLYDQEKSQKHLDSWMLEFNEVKTHHLVHCSAKDNAKLIRFLTGHACGLVLGGGGSRGWVHVGVIKALNELKIPIDEVCGTSVGALVGAMYLHSSSYDDLVDRFSELAEAIGNPYRISNFTWPIISMLSGLRGTEKLQEIFGDMRIEDLSEKFSCVSCNLSQAEEAVHSTGLLWKWLRASASIPGLVPPVTDNGKIYVDGGVINNLPVDIMRRNLGMNGRIVAVDISPLTHSEESFNFPPIITFTDAMLIKFGFEKSKDYLFPAYQNLIMQSLLMGSLDRVKENCRLSDVLIQPDLDKYPALSELSKKECEELISIGYNATISATSEIKKAIYDRRPHWLS